ncbi:MAG TPA: FtsW/RodA/SpoVE family cell cycle protein [Bryobacteraceae bacterium]|nr:FtsW/RodA/SpoVE family cell cycle protein [Bryobacteraceae bacterium]
MAVTRRAEESLATRFQLAAPSRPIERRSEARWLAGCSLLLAFGLVLVFLAKTAPLQGTEDQLRAGQLVDLNDQPSAAQLGAMLTTSFPDDQARQTAAERMHDYLAQQHSPVRNVGALNRLRLPLANLKPLFIVRTPTQFKQAFFTWCSLYLAAFWMVHFAWRSREFRGDPFILPAIHLLTGIALILMVSLRDPLRDTLEFRKFAIGVVAGCLVLLLPLFKLFQPRNFAGLIYTPLFAALALFAALLALGSGPTGSDARVNLGPFQPVELIKILIVYFLAGYFARNWERLRELEQKRYVPAWLRWLELPRISHAVPVMVAVSCALVIFFVLKDMGPGLVMGFLFLVMFAVARRRAALASLGVLVLVVGVTVGYHFGTPHTVADRVSMWLSPWNNDVRGGDQLAQSIWAFATGGPWGSGPGWGDPSVIPAGHTDLVLPAIAEEWGVAGVIAIALLFFVLITRCLRIALRATSEYTMFLALGLATLITLEMLLISAGVLGAIPLSGVVSPFLSSGNTAMLCNFLIFAVLLAISNQSARAAIVPKEADPPHVSPFRFLFGKPVRTAAIVFALCTVLLVLRAASIGAWHDNELMARDTLVYASDRVKRPEHNPRLNLLAAMIPRGDIYDRNGILLATSNWRKLQQNADVYQRLGVSLENAVSPADSRHYPFGPVTLYLLGDRRTGERFHATNASLIEHDSNRKLQGYDNLRDLASVIRYRHQASNPALQALLSKDRDVRSTLDIRLQMRAYAIMQNHLARRSERGALVAMNVATGDALAMVSWPAAADGKTASSDLIDRARYGQYPPGSTFKLVTAMAALRLASDANRRTFTCKRLPDGRAGTVIPGWRRPVRDDIGDRVHGTLDMKQAITVSCNAYFAQLGVYAVGAKALFDTTTLLGLNPGSEQLIKEALPFASYGQGPILATPLQMARVAATIANEGKMMQGRWVLDESDGRIQTSKEIISPQIAAFLGQAMRQVVTSGTARTALTGLDVDVAGKTGTAQLDHGEPHSWFAGFAPYSATPDKQIAFAVVIEHGGYGAKIAAPMAREIVESAAELNIIAAPGKTEH